MGVGWVGRWSSRLGLALEFLYFGLKAVHCVVFVQSEAGWKGVRVPAVFSCVPRPQRPPHPGKWPACPLDQQRFMEPVVWCIKLVVSPVCVGCFLQEKLSTLVFRSSPRLLVVADHVEARGIPGGSQRTAAALRSASRKIRVGFMSKFFTINHAHGQLLQVTVAVLCHP